MAGFALVLFKIILTLVAGIIQSGYALPAHDDVCIHALTPPTNARGVNRASRNSDAPLYRLHFSENIPSDGHHVGPETYHVHVSIENELLAFDTAKILVSSAHGSCGTGSLQFDQQDFIEVKQKEDRCPRLLHTAKKAPMTELPPLLWTPPSCGCVVFKVLVVEEANIFFADNEETKNGPLTQTVCVEKRVTREHFLEALCIAPDRHRSSHILSNPAFLSRHKLDSKKLDRYGVEMALELRRSDNKICCNKVKHSDKINCFDNVRRHRIDRFCGDGVPDLNFVTFRSSFMRDREQKCCFILGEHRYQCFGANSGLKSGTNETYLDYSLDDTDPANDLAIFVLHKDSDVLQVIRSVHFGMTTSSDVSTDNAGKHGSKQTSVEVKSKLADSGSVSPPAGTRVAMSSSSERKEKLKQGESKRRGIRPGDLDASVVQSSGEQLRGNRRRGGSAAETKKASQERGDATRKSDRQRRNSREEMSGAEGLSSDRVMDQRTLGRASGERKIPARTSAERAVPEIFGDRYPDEDLEDQGGSSIEGKLLKYKKQILRLRLKTVCCKAGASAGKFVYSVTNLRARNECSHSGEKYLSRNQLDTGLKTCRDQFRICCMEKAVSGPSMTSGEFRASPFMRFDNQGRTEADYALEEDEPREAPVDGGTDFDQEEIFGQTPDLEGMAEETGPRATRPDEEAKVITPEEDVDGPKKFDEIDNEKEIIDVLDRAEPTREKKVPRAKGDEEVDAYDEREFGVDDKLDDDVDDGLYRMKGQKLFKSKTTRGRESKQASAERSGSLLPAMAQARGSKNYRGASQGGSSARTRGVNSRSSRQRTSRERSSAELRPVYSMYKPHAHVKDRHIGAMDSKEMAAAHGKSFKGTLDSKEMAEAFDRRDIITPVRSGTKKTRRHLRHKK